MQESVFEHFRWTRHSNVVQGYEVFLLSDPLDDILFTTLGQWE